MRFRVKNLASTDCTASSSSELVVGAVTTPPPLPPVAAPAAGAAPTPPGRPPSSPPPPTPSPPSSPSSLPSTASSARPPLLLPSTRPLTPLPLSCRRAPPLGDRDLRRAALATLRFAVDPDRTDDAAGLRDRPLALALALSGREPPCTAVDTELTPDRRVLPLRADVTEPESEPRRGPRLLRWYTSTSALPRAPLRIAASSALTSPSSPPPPRPVSDDDDEAAAAAAAAVPRAPPATRPLLFVRFMTVSNASISGATRPVRGPAKAPPPKPSGGTAPVSLPLPRPSLPRRPLPLACDALRRVNHPVRLPGADACPTDPAPSLPPRRRPLPSTRPTLPVSSSRLCCCCCCRKRCSTASDSACDSDARGGP